MKNVSDWKPNDEFLYTIKQWEIIKGVRILDPDGFNRTDPKLYERFFSEKEFDEALLYCTIEIKIKDGGKND